jgi:hypothetical protein
LAISISNLKTLDTYMRVERWTRDEFALPQLFTDIVEVSYREDQLMQGRRLIDERQIGPQDLRAQHRHSARRHTCRQQRARLCLALDIRVAGGIAGRLLAY